MSLRAAPLVGRRRELALIDRVLAGARDGVAGSLLVIRGEAGIGKSRLAEEAAVRAEASGFRVATGRSWPLGGAPPLWPWHDVLAAVAGADAAGLLEERGGDATLDPERFARFRAVAETLTLSSEAAPILIVLDDMHAADAGAVVLVRFLARSPRLRRVVLLVTHRDPAAGNDSLAHALRDLERDGAVIRLTGLSDAEVGELAGNQGRLLEPGDLVAVQQLTGGNPLLVEELVATSAAGPIDHDSTAVQRALTARLDRLTPDTRRVVEAAAVLGAPASAPELATVCGMPAPAVEAARREAIRAGLVDDGTSGVGFVHDVFREAVLGRMTGAELLAWHQRAAAVLAPDARPEAVERLVRWSHHALAAAPDGPEAADTAVRACRRAARAMMRGFAYEGAVARLREAVEVAGRAGNPPSAELLLELASAILATGSLTDARPAFRAAAEAAEASGDAPILAEAALGLGGIWVLEYRQAAEQEAYHALLQRAIVALGDTRPDLTARLRVRLAADLAYRGTGPGEDVERAVADVRATGDQRGLASALGTEHHIKLGPLYAEERLAIASEMIRTASAIGDGVLTLMGLMWRTVDLLLLARPDAERSLVELRQRTDALGVESVRLVVRHIEVMQLLRAGRFADAESAAADALEVGLRIGDPDASVWYGGQVLARYWFEGRGADLLPLAAELADSPDLPMTNQVFTAAWAALAAEAGQRDEAEAALVRLRAGGGLGAIPQSSALLLTLFCGVEAAALNRDGDVAEEAYRVLAPYADLPVIGSLGVVCFGSVERPLGIAARTFGDLDRAIAHLERAVDRNRQLGNRPMHVIAQADLAGCLLDRGRAEDRRRAESTLAEAIAGAEAMGLDRRVERWRARLAGLAPAAPETAGRLERVGDHWRLAAGVEEATVPDSLGLRYLARLLAAPHRSVSVGELTGRDNGESHHPVLDDRARESYRRRLTELRAEIDEADADADIERSARLRIELDALTDELTKMLRPGGRSRAFAGSQERARTAVQKAIRRAIDRIAAEAPDLADGLRRSVRTGTHCSFEPEAGVPSHWTVA
jgi:hypothetical protein